MHACCRSASLLATASSHGCDWLKAGILLSCGWLLLLAADRPWLLRRQLLSPALRHKGSWCDASAAAAAEVAATACAGCMGSLQAFPGTSLHSQTATWPRARCALCPASGHGRESRAPPKSAPGCAQAASAPGRAPGACLWPAAALCAAARPETATLQQMAAAVWRCRERQTNPAAASPMHGWITRKRCEERH